MQVLLESEREAQPLAPVPSRFLFSVILPGMERLSCLYQQSEYPLLWAAQILQQQAAAQAPRRTQSLAPATAEKSHQKLLPPPVFRDLHRGPAAEPHIGPLRDPQHDQMSRHLPSPRV